MRACGGRGFQVFWMDSSEEMHSEWAVLRICKGINRWSLLVLTLFINPQRTEVSLYLLRHGEMMFGYFLQPC